MNEQEIVLPSIPKGLDGIEPTIPLLYLSSLEAGWKGLVAQAFYEPKEMEGWITPISSDLSLILFAGGAMQMEQRPLAGSWKTRYVRQGDMILRPGDNVEPYEVRWKGLSSAYTQTLHLHLKKELLARTAEEMADRHPARLSFVPRSGLRDPLLLQIGLALWRELEQDSPGGQLYAQTAAHMLAVHLLRHYTSSSTPIKIKEPSQGLTQHQVRLVTDFILAHLAQDLSLEALAQQAGFSSYYFARLFRQTTGESPHQFVLRQRIEKAQHLLKETDMPLTQVALETGFANQSHLAQALKRHLGLTPRAIRQEQGHHHHHPNFAGF
jgi:AraC family transcriptional regulator